RRSGGDVEANARVFAELFSFNLPARVNFVGGGGKTSLILELAREYSAWVQVLYTTTTRIHPPPAAEGRVLLSGDEPALLASALFRWELAAPRLGLTEGEALTPERAAAILLHPEGVCKDWRPPCRIVPFINKVDRDADVPMALELARALRASPTFPVERVLWGSVEQGRAGAWPD